MIPISIKNEMTYEPDTGEFRWCRDSNNRNRLAGDIAGGLNTRGYWRFKYQGKEYLAHQVAWWWVYGEWPSLEIDHKNRNRSDNRIENLRLATAAQQRANAKINKDNSSGYRGVYWNKSRKKWRAYIQHEHLGSFNSKEAAIVAHTEEFNRRFGQEWRGE